MKKQMQAFCNCEGSANEFQKEDQSCCVEESWRKIIFGCCCCDAKSKFGCFCRFYEQKILANYDQLGISIQDFRFFIAKNAMIDATCEQIFKIKQGNKIVKYIRCNDAGENQGLKSRLHLSSQGAIHPKDII
jgi:hypothetical protein